MASVFSAAESNSFSAQLLLLVVVAFAPLQIVVDKLRFDFAFLFRIFVAPNGY